MLVTSVLTDESPEGSVDVVAVSEEGAWRTRTPRLSVSPPGAGDLTAAVFLANLLDAHPKDVVLARTTSSVFAVVEATEAAGEREMQIVQSQELLAHPRMEFVPERLR